MDNPIYTRHLQDYSQMIFINFLVLLFRLCNIVKNGFQNLKRLSNYSFIGCDNYYEDIISSLLQFNKILEKFFFQ